MSRPNAQAPGGVEFPEPIMLPPIHLSSRDRTQWERLDIGRPLPGGELPPVGLRPDTTGWPVVQATGSGGEWLGSYDERGNRLDPPGAAGP